MIAKGKRTALLNDKFIIPTRSCQVCSKQFCLWDLALIICILSIIHERLSENDIAVLENIWGLYTTDTTIVQNVITAFMSEWDSYPSQVCSKQFCLWDLALIICILSIIHVV